MCSTNQISAAVDACLAMMGGDFDLRALQQNDPNYDWEFMSMATLAEEYGITGLYTLSHGVMVTVCFQSGMTEQETHQIIAHELGHHMLHRNLEVAEIHIGRKILTDERREWEAESFAELLLERCGIRTAAEANA